MVATVAVKQRKFILEENGKQTCTYCGGMQQLIEGCGIDVALLELRRFYKEHALCGDLLPDDKVPLALMGLLKLRVDSAKKQWAENE